MIFRLDFRVLLGIWDLEIGSGIYEDHFNRADLYDFSAILEV